MAISVQGQIDIILPANMAVVKKTVRFSSVFFYNHLCHPFVFGTLFLKSGASPGSRKSGGFESVAVACGT
jgi:hypothetical protein